MSPKALAVRGGAAVGPIDEARHGVRPRPRHRRDTRPQALAMNTAKTVAGVSIGSAVLEKFLGAKSTTLSDAVSGDTATTNAVITFAAYATSIVSGEAFGATETAAALWIASAVLKLKDAGIDADSIKDNAVNIIIATVMGVIAFAE